MNKKKSDKNPGAKRQQQQHMDGSGSVSVTNTGGDRSN